MSQEENEIEIRVEVVKADDDIECKLIENNGTTFNKFNCFDTCSNNKNLIHMADKDGYVKLTTDLSDYAKDFISEALKQNNKVFLHFKYDKIKDTVKLYTLFSATEPCVVNDMYISKDDLLSYDSCKR
jgi:hypothetical protein